MQESAKHYNYTTHQPIKKKEKKKLTKQAFLWGKKTQIRRNFYSHRSQRAALLHTPPPSGSLGRSLRQTPTTTASLPLSQRRECSAFTPLLSRRSPSQARRGIVLSCSGIEISPTRPIWFCSISFAVSFRGRG